MGGIWNYINIYVQKKEKQMHEQIISTVDKSSSSVLELLKLYVSKNSQDITEHINNNRNT